jgi:hypothetical protein
MTQGTSFPTGTAIAWVLIGTETIAPPYIAERLATRFSAAAPFEHM